MRIPNWLNENNVDFELIPHRTTYDAQRLAAAIHVTGRDVAKTVLLRAGGGDYIVAVLPANKTIDLERTSQLLGEDALELATEIEISQHCPDCEMGSLPPFGSQYGMRTLLDESLSQDDEVVFEGNTHQEAIRMKFDDFVRIEQPLIGSFARAN